MADAGSLIHMQLAQAAADAAQARNSLLIGYGDPTLAMMLLGQPSAAAAEANPFSTLKNLDYQGGLNRDELEEGLNRANVWYGSAHAAKLAQLDRSLLGQKAEASGQVQSALAQIARQLRDAQFQGQMSLADQSGGGGGPVNLLGMGGGGGIPGFQQTSPLPRELYPGAVPRKKVNRGVP